MIENAWNPFSSSLFPSLTLSSRRYGCSLYPISCKRFMDYFLNISIIVFEREYWHYSSTIDQPAYQM